MSSTLIKPSKKVSKRDYYVTIDSRDRDRNMWPLSSYYPNKLILGSSIDGVSDVFVLAIMKIGKFLHQLI